MIEGMKFKVINNNNFYEQVHHSRQYACIPPKKDFEYFI